MPGQAINVLVVDDDELMVRGIIRNLELSGCSVLSAAGGLEGINLTRECRPDLVLLDLMMPGVDGFEACRRIREFSAVPIVMLTGMGHPRDKARGLDLGADDYLAKPFSYEELIARIRAVLRRAKGAAAIKKCELFEYAQVQINTLRHEVKVRGEIVDLTPMEFKLFLTLVENADRVLEHRELLGMAWGPGYRDDLGYLRVYIRRLRQKIEKQPSAPEYLRTVARVGYVFGLQRGVRS